MAGRSFTPTVPVGPELDNRRVAAAVIDLCVPAALVLATFAAGMSLTPPLVAAIVGWSLFYFFALESGAGQTLGKRLLGLRVTRPDGTPADLEQIAKRTITRIVDGHIVGLVVMLITGERRQRLGDIVAGTVVTNADAAPTAARAPAPRRPVRAPLPTSARPLADNLPSAAPAPVAAPIAAALEPIAIESEPEPIASEPVEPVEPDIFVYGSPTVEPEPPATIFAEPSLEQPVALDNAPSIVFEPIDDTPAVEIEREPRVEITIDRAPADPEPRVDFTTSREPAVEQGASYEPQTGVDIDHEPDVQFTTAHQPRIEIDREPCVEITLDRPVEPASKVEVNEPALIVKPIQTVSAIDLIMQDAKQRHSAG